MGRSYDGIDERLSDWLSSQPVFFVATAPLARDGHVNCSPKGNRNEFAVLDAHRVAYLDQTGSGTETIAHLKENGRIVLMFCAFEGPPRIVRLHGTGRPLLADDPEFARLADVFEPPRWEGARSVVVVQVDRIADSCGYGVPLMPFEGHRRVLDDWVARKGEEGIRAYWASSNQTSLDGLEGVPVKGRAGEPAASA